MSSGAKGMASATTPMSASAARLITVLPTRPKSSGRSSAYSEKTGMSAAEMAPPMSRS